MVKIFLTGATGYIGGDALNAIVEAHPEYDITCLARSEEKAKLLTNKFPSLSVVLGDLDDSDLLVEQATNADIVCHLADCEHIGAAQAIFRGLSTLGGATKSVIHLSGSDILCFEDLKNSTYGTTSDKFYNDLQGVDEILSIPEGAPHQNVDSIITRLGSENESVKVAIVCPPAIFGKGRGPGNTRSIQVPELVFHTLKRGISFMVGRGENRWATVHVHDLSQMVAKLVEDAASKSWRATWGPKGFYFTGSGLTSWGKVSAQVAQAAFDQGFLESPSVESLSWEAADQIWEYSSLFLGTNSMCTSYRAKKMLAWEPKAQTLDEEIPELVKQEAATLGLESLSTRVQ